MKNTIRYLFVMICIAICILPFAGMSVCPTEKTTENRKMAAFPAITTEDGKPNIHFLQELGTYFEDHFAFRLELVSADAEIQSKIFQVSNADSVIAGRNGWLYYASTADDYLGKNTMSERGIKNIAHNLSLVQQYVEEHGAKFIFTVPPNKNTLYGENMPYYLQHKISSSKNITLLEKQLENDNISYCSLVSLFQNQEEVLYLKRDSHWNNKGAVLVYNALLEQAGVAHDRYEGMPALRLKTEYGDLCKMLYPATAQPEWNYFYKKWNTFSYVTDTKSVEEPWIETANRTGTGQLLMFRDSFGNTLLPLMANTFSNGYFSKGVPQNIAGYMDLYHPDVVIIEKVERNIRELAMEPPLLDAAPIILDGTVETMESDTSLEVKKCESNSSYLEIAGTLAPNLCGLDAEIYVKVSNDTEQEVYRAFHVTNEKSDYGYKLYLPEEKLDTKDTLLEIVVAANGTLRTVQSCHYR